MDEIKIIKEIICVILFIIISVGMLFIAFFEFTPLKDVPKAETYQKTEETTALLSEIQNEIDEENSKTEEEKVVLESYELTNSIIETNFEQKSYDQGKSNPFSSDTGEEVTTTNTNTVGETTNSESSTSTNTTSSNTVTTSNNTVRNSNTTSSTNTQNNGSTNATGRYNSKLSK